MLLYVELAMFAAGLAAAGTGRIALSRERPVEGIPARLAGLALAAPLPLAFCIGFVISARAGAKGVDVDNNAFRATLFLIDLLLVIGCGVVAAVIGLFGGESEEQRRYAAEAMWFEDPDAARILYPGYKPSKARLAEMEYGPKKRRRPKPTKGNGALIASLSVIGLMFAVAGYLIFDFLAAPAPPAGGGARPWNQNWNAPPPPTDEEKREATEKAQARAQLAAEERERASAEQSLAGIEADAAAIRKQAEFAEARKREEAEAVAEQARQARERAEADAKKRAAALEKPLADLTEPAPRAGSGQVLAARQRGEGLTWADLKLDPPAPPAPKPKTPANPAPKPKPPAPTDAPAANSTPVAGMAWASDGNSFVVATAAGLVRRVGYPDLKELRRTDLKQTVSAVAACAPGLLLTLGDLGELWLLDPGTLAVTKRFGVATPGKVLTGPTLGVAYVAGGATVERLPVRLDLADGTLTALVLGTRRPLPESGASPSSLEPALAPDGKSLFYDDGELARYRIEADKVEFDGATPQRMGDGPRRGIFTSPDGKLVCLPTGGGNDGTGAWVYDAADFAEPAVLVKPGAYPGVVGFDPSGKRVFAQNSLTPLLVFDAAGATKGAHKLGRTVGSAVREFAGHPTDGKGLLVRTTDQVIVVQFAKAAE